jgi:tetratricopeptide (TPR) repeat protein
MGNHEFAFANLQEVLDGSGDESFKKTALLEMASTHYQAGRYQEALKTYGIYRRRYPQDAGLPHVLFYQGLLLRELGAPQAALAKFHTVLSAALNLNLDQYNYYRRIVLLAQAQIADTLYTQGKLEEAADKYDVLMQDESSELNRGMVQYRLILCLEGLARHSQLVERARNYLDQFGETAETPHVRYLLSSSLKQLGRNGEALKEVKTLLETAASQDSAGWKAWQQRTGNEIANQLYQDGDYFGALTLYLKLTELDESPQWRLPVWYQIGLIHERLDSPPEAIKAYQQILDLEAGLGAQASAALLTIVDMARWRRDFIQWKFEAEKARIQLQQPFLKPEPTETASNR